MTAVAVSPDGRRLLSGPSRGFGLDQKPDFGIRLWDADTGLVIRVLGYHRDSVVHVAFVPGREAAVSVSWDGTLRVWPLDPASGELPRLVDLGILATSLALTPDGKHALVGCLDRTIRVIELAKVPASPAAPLAPPLAPLSPLAPLPGPSGLTIPRINEATRFPVFHPDGRHLLTPDGKDVTVWDVTTQKKVRTFTGLADRVMAVRLTAGGKTVVALSSGKRVMGWDWETGKQQGEFHAPAMPEPIALTVFPDGARVAIPVEPGFVSVRELPTGKEVARIDLKDPTEWVCTLTASPDGRWLAVVGKRGRVHLWDATVGKIAADLPGVPLSIDHAVGGFSLDGKFLGVGASAALRVWPVGEWTVKPMTVATDASGLVAFDDAGVVVTAPVQPFNGVVAVCRWDYVSAVAVGRSDFSLAQRWNHCALPPDGRTLAVDVESRRAFVLVPFPPRPALAPMPRETGGQDR